MRATVSIASVSRSALIKRTLPTRTFQSGFASTPTFKSQVHSTMKLKEFVSRFETRYPVRLAESWDNVGLLVEPSGEHQVERILLTNDLTEVVLEEAFQKKVDLIFSYHPPIFAPTKKLTQDNWKVTLA